jgi:ABC-type transport system involved in multi-copper enzyme maturation permease subunit
MNLTLSMDWLTGPILGKELRVSSRRQRNYWLRFFYVILLLVPLIILFQSGVVHHANQATSVARLSEAGMTMTVTMVWFQFIAAQLIAIVMLSTSISDELTHRTLGVLMTTPINSLQIVMGKFVSKLYQLVLIIAISMPLLAVIRVFGGIPWGYLLASLCITLTSMLFAGSLSLLFSVWGRHAYSVIIRTVVTLAVLFLLMPMLFGLGLGMLGRGSMVQSFVFGTLQIANPFFALQIETMKLMSPGTRPPVFLGINTWPFHCALMLLLCLIVLAMAVSMVRRVALRQISGQVQNPKTRKTKSAHADSSSLPLIRGKIREVRGAPVVWKELRTPFIRGSKKKNIIGLVIALIALFSMYALNVNQHCLHEDFTQSAYVIMFMVMGLTNSLLLSAAVITREKESQSWPILLTTPLTAAQILWGKALGTFGRGLPVWLFLFGHMIVFMLVGYIHPVAVYQITMVVASTVVFLSGAGLYFGTRFRRTTTAVVVNMALALILWAVVPVVLGVVSSISRSGSALECYMNTHPLFQTGVIMQAAGGRNNARDRARSLDYKWVSMSSQGGDKTISYTHAVLGISAVVYVGVGLLFAYCAQRRLRYAVF